MAQCSANDVPLLTLSSVLWAFRDTPKGAGRGRQVQWFCLQGAHAKPVPPLCFEIQILLQF